MDRAYLQGVTAEQLRSQLATVESKKGTQRLMVALNYKHGVSPTDMADWYDLSRRTIYNWLERLEEEPIEQAVSDRSRPGRPSRLDDAQLDRLSEALRRSPSDCGYQSCRWRPELLRRHIQETYDVEYSLRRVYDLLEELGENERSEVSRKSSGD
jgi:transposase